MAKNERERDDAPQAPDDAKRPGREHPAGPHADPRLTNEEATPGAGALPDPHKDEVDPGAG